LLAENEVKICIKEMFARMPVYCGRQNVAYNNTYFGALTN